MSGDPGQEYFADGVVEEIITALSRFRGLFVIARNSSFTYKDRAVEVKQVGRELGVRYVLEGSVRKAAEPLRITGQLIDASTGMHLWADRFDGGLAEVFELQDRVATSVVSAIAPRLEEAEIARARRKPTADLSAYDYYWPRVTFADHLGFALRHEPIDMLILKRAFDAVPQAEVEAFVRAAATGLPARRAWFLYETLTPRTLDVPDAPEMTSIDLLDPKLYVTGKSRVSKRHRVRDNLLGTGRFCPVIRRTDTLTDFIGRGLDASARETVGRTGAHLVARAASFMLLADSRASFEIEGERPPRNRLERWARAVLQAGKIRSPLMGSSAFTAC